MIILIGGTVPKNYYNMFLKKKIISLEDHILGNSHIIGLIVILHLPEQT